ncbi:MAG: hypothetical protein ACOYEV_17620, partial [Candidatus Nanopelagicales bacterium]
MTHNLEPAQVWQERAGAAQEVLVERFWQPRAGLFRADSGRAAHWKTGLRLGAWNYWWQAQAMEAQLWAYARGDEAAGERARLLMAGVRRRARSLSRNRLYDDLAWLGLACARAHDLGLVDREPA